MTPNPDGWFLKIYSCLKTILSSVMNTIGLVLVFLFLASLGVFSTVVEKLKSSASWSQVYRQLSKRYGGNTSGFKNNAGSFAIGIGLKKPYLYFNYGRTFCRLRNRTSSQFSTNRSTEMLMDWRDRKLKLIVATVPQQSHLTIGMDPVRQVFVDQPQFQSDYHVSSNRPEVAKRMLNNGVQWQIEQLRRHTGEPELSIKIAQGKLLVAKPGYIKGKQDLEDFVRFSLELFDQLMLFDAEGLEFVNDNEACVVRDVKCPICSEEILQNLVVCTRCKTPHCRDCWQYNGQCATFACSEKRFIRTGEVSV